MMLVHFFRTRFRDNPKEIQDLPFSQNFVTLTTPKSTLRRVTATGEDNRLLLPKEQVGKFSDSPQGRATVT